jgi:hypothetical protein
MDENGWFDIADTFRKNIENAIKIANDPDLTQRQKVGRLKQHGSHGRIMPRSAGK